MMEMNREQLKKTKVKGFQFTFSILNKPMDDIV